MSEDTTAPSDYELELSLPNPTELKYAEQMALRQMLHANKVALRDRFIAFFNELLKECPDDVTAIFNQRTEVSQKMVEHPTVVCDGQNRIGILGVINGMLTENTRVASLHSSDGTLIGFTAYAPSSDA